MGGGKRERTQCWLDIVFCGLDSRAARTPPKNCPTFRLVPNSIVKIDRNDKLLFDFKVIKI